MAVRLSPDDSGNVYSLQGTPYLFTQETVVRTQDIFHSLYSSVLEQNHVRQEGSPVATMGHTLSNPGQFPKAQGEIWPVYLSWNPQTCSYCENPLNNSMPHTPPSTSEILLG